MPHDLSEYLSEFSDTGSVPTSLSGYGYGQRTHQRELSALSANPSTATKPTAAKAPASGNITVGTDSVQKVLIALGYPATGLTDGKFGKTSKAAWENAARTKPPVPSNGFIDGALGAKSVAVNAATYQVLSNIAQATLDQKKVSQQPAVPGAPKTQDQITGPEPKPWVVVGGVRVARIAVPVRDLQLHLDALQAGPSRSGSYDSKTKAAWDKYAKIFKEPRPELAQASGSSAWAWINPDAMARLRERGNRAAVPTSSAAPQKTSASPTTSKAAARPASQTANPSPQPATPAVVAKGDLVATTSDVQSLLKRLGWTDSALKNTFGAKPGALDDGTFGSTTQKAWAQSASKRKLNGRIAKASADGKQVTVLEETYLKLRAVADALVPQTAPDNSTPPIVGGSLLSLSPSGLTQISVARFGEVLGRITGATASANVDLQAVYARVAKDLKVDARSEQTKDGNVIVLKDAWNAVMAKFDAMAPKQAQPTGAKKSDQDNAVATIVKASTSSVPVSTVRTAFNAAIQQGLMQRAVFAAGAWEEALREPTLDFIGVKTEPARSQWAAALVSGKLVSKDGKTLKLPKMQADSFKAAAAKYQKAQAEQKAASSDIKGYTKVNAADLIGKINGLNVSTVVFNRNGGGKELADAIATFFTNTKTAMPSGDPVRLLKQDVYVKDAVLTALASAVSDAAARQAATRDLRSKLVADALKDSTAMVSVLDFQQAIAESVRSGKAGANKKLYSAVKLTNAFDKATRAAYTTVAQTLTIGAAILDAEKKLQAAMGANYKKALTEELRNNVWGDFLTQAVSGTSIKTMPVIAQTITEAAAVYRSTNEGKQSQAKVAKAQSTALVDAINKSTKVVAIVDVQQALLQMVSNKEISKVSGLKITGRSDKATNKGLFELSGFIFPEGYKIADTTWASYLKAVGLNVVSNSNVVKGWPNANYVALPPSVADLVLKRAGEYVYAHGAAQVQIAQYNKASTVSAAAPAPVTSSTASAPVAADAGAARAAALETATRECAARGGTLKVVETAAGQNWICLLGDGQQTQTPATAAVNSMPAAPQENSAMPGPTPQPVVFSTDEATAQPSAPLAPETPMPATDTSASSVLTPTADAPATDTAAPASDSHTGLYLLGGVAALASYFALKGKGKGKGGEKNNKMRYAKP